MIEQIIKNIIKREGGYVDHPNDRGGATKYGITGKALVNYLGRSVDKDDIKNISKKDAYEIYYSRYYQRPKIDQLPQDIQEIALDMSVNHGSRRAVIILQKTLNMLGVVVKIDGRIGPKTITATQSALALKGVVAVTCELIEERIRFYEYIVKRDETQRVFLAGWVNRAESFRQVA